MFKRFTHNVLGWGYPNKRFPVKSSELPCASSEVICICGELIIKDRGGWYHSVDYEQRTGEQPRI